MAFFIFRHQFSSVAQLCPTLCNPMNCSTPGLPVHHQLPEFTQTHVHRVLCCPLLLLPPIISSIRVFCNESTLCMRWLKYWSFSFSICPSKEGNGTPLQHSCQENPMDGGAWWATVYGVAKSRTRLSNFTFIFHFYALEKKMATHSSVLAWRIPGTGKPGGLPSMGSHRVGHD